MVVIVCPSLRHTHTHTHTEMTMQAVALLQSVECVST